MDDGFGGRLDALLASIGARRRTTDMGPIFDTTDPPAPPHDDPALGLTTAFDADADDDAMAAAAALGLAGSGPTWDDVGFTHPPPLDGGPPDAASGGVHLAAIEGGGAGGVAPPVSPSPTLWGPTPTPGTLFVPDAASFTACPRPPPAVPTHPTKSASWPSADLPRVKPAHPATRSFSASSATPSLASGSPAERSRAASSVVLMLDPVASGSSIAGALMSPPPPPPPPAPARTRTVTMPAAGAWEATETRQARKRRGSWAAGVGGDPPTTGKKPRGDAPTTQQRGTPTKNESTAVVRWEPGMEGRLRTVSGASALSVATTLSAGSSSGCPGGSDTTVSVDMSDVQGSAEPGGGTPEEDPPAAAKGKRGGKKGGGRARSASFAASGVAEAAEGGGGGGQEDVESASGGLPSPLASVVAQVRSLVPAKVFCEVDSGAGYMETKVAKVFFCPVEGCGKPFTRRFNLKTHLNVHNPTRPRPFPCPEPSCTKSFVRIHDLERHAVVHSGDKLYVCEACGVAFTRLDARKRHVNMGKCRGAEGGGGSGGGRRRGGGGGRGKKGGKRKRGGSGDTGEEEQTVAVKEEEEESELSEPSDVDELEMEVEREKRRRVEVADSDGEP
ncbi:hypothetical protein HDU96_009920 [Phlyctochytrium bullatum]|nr:hypothetical protein HDU96_009920 [Phlyctochytrium bullatum]